MMDLKKKLIEEIEKINDTIVLEQLTQIIVQSNQSLEVEFTELQISRIKESQNQIENGEFLDHDDVMNMIGND